MSYDWDKISELCNNVERYAELENNEFGESTLAMISVLRYPDYISDKVFNILVNELEIILKDYQENCEIVETIETREIKIIELLKYGYS